MFSHTTTHVDIPIIKTGGQEIDRGLIVDLLDLRIEQSIHLPDVATIRFNDPEFEHFDATEFSIGDELIVELTNDEDEQHEVFSGEVTGLSIEPGGGKSHELVITALGKGHRLARNVNVRSFTEMTDTDIVASIAADHSLQTDIDSTATVHTYVLQSESDFEFLTRRALLLGFRWWIRGSTLHFKDVEAPVASKTLTWGDDLQAFRVRLSSADSVSGVSVRAWDPESQSAVVGSWTATANREQGLASDAPAATSVAKDAEWFGDSGRFESRTLADTVTADSLARSLGRRAASSQVRLKGTADGDPALAPGLAVTLADVGMQLAGDYTITKTEHILGGGGTYITKFVCEGLDPSDLVALIGNKQREPATTGLMVGVVTAINDSDNPARIRVKLPTLSDDDESAWARLAAPGAGASTGLQMLPEIEDEVIVGFEQGDPLRPVILGGLWSNTKAPPVEHDTAVVNDLVSIRALYTRLGHKIELTDVDGGETSSITIELADGAGTVNITQDGGITIDTPKDVEVTAGGKISMTATGDLSLKGANVKIEADAKVTIDGTEIAAKGSAKLDLEGALSTLKASGSLSMDGGGMAELKGGMVQIN